MPPEYTFLMAVQFLYSLAAGFARRDDVVCAVVVLVDAVLAEVLADEVLADDASAATTTDGTAIATVKKVAARASRGEIMP
jgi:hypothetical protein